MNIFINFNWRQYWRIVLSMFIGYVAIGLLLYPILPESYWFSRFWVSGALGNFLGFLIGVVWYIRSVKPISKNSLRFLLFAGVFIAIGTSIGLFVMVPFLQGQEKELKFIYSLSKQNISQVTITIQGRNPLVVTEPEIATFKRYLENARFFGERSHELSIEEFQIEIEYEDGRIIYDANVTERHLNDVALDYKINVRIFKLHDEILLPGLNKWLDQKVIN